MTGDVVLFGATGYTGRLTARAMVDRGLSPRLVGRDASRLRALAAELGGLPTTVADVSHGAALAAVLQVGDVLVSTVGPFARHGQTALDAAIGRGATYLDSTGEHAFLRRVFGAESARAQDAGVALLPAFGYDYVPGTLAAALALGDAGAAARRVDVGYFVRKPHRPSGGTSASGARMAFEPAWALRDGRLEPQRVAAGSRSFPVDGRTRDAVLFGGTEPFTLPRTFASVQDVTVYLGWMRPLAAPAQVGSWLAYNAARVAPVRAGMDAVVRRVVRGSSGGPDDAARAAARTVVCAEVYDGADALLATATVEGPDPYGLTASLLAWAAQEAAEGRVAGVGALGPLDAFGVDGLTAGCAALGLVRQR